MLFIFPMNGILVTLAFKPVIDATWNNGFLGMNLLRIIGVAVPLLILPRILHSRGKQFLNMELAWVAIALFSFNMLGATGLVAAGKFNASLDFFLRVLNGFLSFFLFQHYFAEKENFRKLLLALMIAGLFPVLVGIYQFSTGHVWRIHTTSMGMMRYAGLYHNSVSVRIFGFQTLTAILLYWSYFASRKYGVRLFLALYAFACALVIFRAYTKTGMANLFAWAVIWSIFTRKLHWLLVIAILTLTINFTAGNRIFKDTERVFMKEIGAYEGTMDEKYILAGRTLIWKDALKQWSEENIFFKMFGSGANPPVHNEYLRILICNGIFGLLAFISAMAIISMRVVKNMLSRASPLNVVAVMIFVMLFLDTIGLHPGLYPAYQWYVYGFITLSLCGVKGLESRLENSHGGRHAAIRQNRQEICSSVG